MNCADIKELLTRHLLGELTADMAATVRAHLADCAACRAEADELGRTLDLLRSALAESPAAASQLDDARRQRVLASARSGATDASRTLAFPWWSAWRRIEVLKVAAMLVVTVGIFSLLLPHAQFSRKPSPVAAKDEPKASRTYAAPAAKAEKQMDERQMLPAPGGVTGARHLPVLADIHPGGEELPSSRVTKNREDSTRDADGRVNHPAAPTATTAPTLSPPPAAAPMPVAEGVRAYSYALKGGAAPAADRKLERSGLAVAADKLDVSSMTVTAGGTISAAPGKLESLAKAAAAPAEPMPTKAPRRTTDVNHWTDAAAQPVSVIPPAVDTDSYVQCRNCLLAGRRPPPEIVRTEGFVNYFDYGYAPRARELFAIHPAVAPSPFNSSTSLLRIGIKGRQLPRERQPGARLTFRTDDRTAATNAIASGVAIEVVFNPDRVKRYRRIGYEQQLSQDAEASGTAIHAGDFGPGQEVTALYEVEFQGDAQTFVGMVHVRGRDTATGQVKLTPRPITAAMCLMSFGQADMPFRLAAVAAGFAGVLRGSPYAGCADCADVVRVLRPVAMECPLDRRVQELLRMVQAAQNMPPAAPETAP